MFPVTGLSSAFAERRLRPAARTDCNSNCNCNCNCNCNYNCNDPHAGRHSPDAAKYPSPSSFPAAVTRRCCSAQEFLFTGAMMTDAKKVYDTMMLAGDFIVAVNYVAMSTLAMRSWADWRRSGRCFFFAWAFPFLLKVLDGSDRPGGGGGVPCVCFSARAASRWPSATDTPTPR